MVNATSSTTEPQVFTVNNLQDVFELIGRGFEVYNQAAAIKEPVAEESTASKSPEPTPLSSHKKRSYQPDLDILETPDAIVVEVSLPGVDKTAINIEYDVKLNQVSLTGDYKRATLEDNVKLIRRERPHTRFERVVGLNSQVVQADLISATYVDGVLTVTIPKNKEAEARKTIRVQ